MVNQIQSYCIIIEIVAIPLEMIHKVMDNFRERLR